MAHHQQTNFDRVHAAQAVSRSTNTHNAGEKPLGGDDEHADVDEPPDQHIRFGRIAMPPRSSSMSALGPRSPYFLHTRNASLLTQALLSSSDHTSSSEAEAPVLTSDGGITSPTTPSPQLPPVNTSGIVSLPSKDQPLPQEQAQTVGVAPIVPHSDETSLEAGLKQRRCIKFACGRQNTPQTKEDGSDHSQIPSGNKETPSNPPKRPCMLRFACPFKAATEAVRSQPMLESKKSTATPNREFGHRPRSESATSIVGTSAADKTLHPNEAGSPGNTAPKRQKLEKSEAIRFHAFGGSFNAEDEWTKEEFKDQPKLTVNDTLRKENAIRKLGQEAEEEAIEEDEEQDQGDEDSDDAMEDPDDDAEFSDGNETDNEEGFADSDDDSDTNSDYHFWTPGLTTAATSTEHVEHIRPLGKRMASDSSIDSLIHPRERRSSYATSARRINRSRSTVNTERMRPGTPELPDSTDFVCGTLDEDRPIEAAYVSCLEERKRSKHRPIPQDIDPSFPTSDPEMDEEDDDDDEDDDGITRSSDGSDAWVAGRPDDSDSDEIPLRRQPQSRRAGKSPMPSPKRMRSPPPPGKRATVHRSPPPRRLFGQSPPSKLAPPNLFRDLKSPLSTRMTSPSTSPKRATNAPVLARLAQRPHLTHTASLPRTPNPFWSKHRKDLEDLDDHSTGTSPNGQEIHNRGPIDIVKGLENRRQRRREKIWRQHCRTAGKDKERRCQPGKGAERMREVGLEMAEKCKGYGAKPKVVLSV